MTAAAAQIERAFRTMRPGARFDRRQILALGMDGAVDIGFGARAELGLDDFLVRFGCGVHCSAPSSLKAEWLGFKLLQAR